MESDLREAWLFGVKQWADLHMLRNQRTCTLTELSHLLPALQDIQSFMLIQLCIVFLSLLILLQQLCRIQVSYSFLYTYIYIYIYVACTLIKANVEVQCHKTIKRCGYFLYLCFMPNSFFHWRNRTQNYCLYYMKVLYNLYFILINLYFNLLEKPHWELWRSCWEL